MFDAGTHDRPASGSWAARMLLVLVALVTALSAVESRAELPDIKSVVRSASPAVVNISTVKKPASAGTMPQEIPEMFRRFFGDPRRGQPGVPFRQPESLGSGFIISEDGFVLTNHHVVDDAEEIVVRLTDRREYIATLVGSDARSDLALLKVDADDLPTVRIGNSSRLEVGDWVLAIGSPFGFDYSVTAGIVSATGRSLPNEDLGNYVPFIQTDVAINPGNSGGPLFNLDGEVVGINSQIYTRSGGFMGLSFSIPIDLAMDVVKQLRTDGRVARGWIGVQIQEVNRDLAESFGLDKPHGALVNLVLEDTPAERAGLQAGDVIVRFDGEEIQFSAELPYRVGRIRPGTTVKMVVVREQRERTIEIEIGALPDSGEEIAAMAPQGAQSPDAALGMQVRPPDPGEDDSGVRVVAVEPDGPAARAGIRPGDVVRQIGRTAIGGVADFRATVDGLPPGQSVPVLIVRGGTRLYLPLRVPD